MAYRHFKISEHHPTSATVATVDPVSRQTVANVATVAEPESETAFFGAELEGDISERAAIADIEGGVPPIFSLAFAAFQIGCPAGSTVERWQLAMDDAGRFLDRHGHEAAVLGWLAADLFSADGLAWILKGAAVVNLTATAAILSDGRILKRRSGVSPI